MLKLKLIYYLALLLFLLPPVSFAGEYYITTTAAPVKTGEGIAYPASFILPKGSEVEVLSKTSSYYKIRYLEKTGYVYAGYLQYSRTGGERGWGMMVPGAGVGFIAIVLGLAVYIGRIVRDRKMLGRVTTRFRGTATERKLVMKLLKGGIPGDRIFHDLYVRDSAGDFAQIDLVVVTDAGIIVIEVKKLSGWLLGNGKDSHWTQVLAYGKQKYRLYNPILQNNQHVTVLKKQLARYGNIPFYSMVVFYGDCVLKDINYVPQGSFLVKERRFSDVMKVIGDAEARADYRDETAIFRVLRDGVINGASADIQARHRQRIEDMVGKGRVFE